MMTFDYGTYGYIAMKDLKAAEMNVEMCPHISAQCSHAAVEKMLKHLILVYKEDSSERREMLKKHKPRVLIRYLNIDLLNSFTSQLAEFDTFYYETRYPGEEYYDVTVEQARDMLSIAHNLCADAITFLGQPQCNYEPQRHKYVTGINKLKLDELTE